MKNKRVKEMKKSKSLKQEWNIFVKNKRLNEEELKLLKQFLEKNEKLTDKKEFKKFIFKEVIKMREIIGLDSEDFEKGINLIDSGVKNIIRLDIIRVIPHSQKFLDMIIEGYDILSKAKEITNDYFRQ